MTANDLPKYFYSVFVRKAIDFINTASPLTDETLSFLDTNFVDDHSELIVNSVRDYFVLDKSSTLTADGITIIQPATGPGRWIRENTPRTSWLYQSTWYVDPTNGYDENNGLTSGAALKTVAELARRWAGRTIPQTTTVYIMSDTTTNDLLNVNVTLAAGVNLHFIGAMVTTRVGTITAIANANHSAQTPPTLTDTTLSNAFSWSSDLGKPVILNSDTLTWTWKAVGGYKVNTGFWGLSSANQTALNQSLGLGVINGSTARDPKVNDTYEVVSLPSVNLGLVNVRAEGAIPTSYTTGVVLFENLNFISGSGAHHRLASQGPVVEALNCSFAGDWAFLADANSQDLRVYLANCLFGGQVTMGPGAVTMSACVVRGGNVNVTGTHCKIDTDTLIVESTAVQDGAIYTSNGSAITLNGVAIFDSTCSASLQIGAYSTVNATGLVWGNNSSGVGVIVQHNGCLVYNSSIVPTVTGAISDFRIGTTTDATSPFNLDRFKYQTGHKSTAINNSWSNLVAATPSGFGGSAVNVVNGAKITPAFTFGG
jgi:hypothetical protein